ncbi:MAG: phosphate ABC transporter substrate-binding protein [Defluviitaleaceae bacterium]|nr:phosphate ABC transporter substrate-binding protein [Defluviitaleaceae bacterium]
MKFKLLGLLAILTSLLTACGGGGAYARVIVAGSTSVQPYSEILAEEFVFLNPEITIDVQGGGSSSGIRAASTGTSDIGMSSRALNEDEMDYWVVEIARDGLAIVVNPQNPIHELSFEQLQHVFTGEITNWGEVGGNDARIHLIAREEGSGTRGAFEELVMADGQFITPRAIVQSSNGSVRQLVSSDPNSIGFLSLGLVDDTVRALDLDGVAATAENVISGTYNLFRPFLYISREAPEGATAKFIDFILSPYGKAILAEEGLIP